MPVGSLLVVASVDPREVRAGDVVTVALDSGSLLTHRVVRVTSLDGYPAVELHGDANAVADVDVVSLDRLVGRVTLAAPFAGYAAWSLANPAGLAAFVALIGLIAVASRALGRRSWRPRRRHRRIWKALRRGPLGAQAAVVERGLWLGLDRPVLALALARRARRRRRSDARLRCVLHRVRGCRRQHVHHRDVGTQRLPQRVVGAMERGQHLGALQRARMGCRDQATVECGRCRDRQRRTLGQRDRRCRGGPGRRQPGRTAHDRERCRRPGRGRAWDRRRPPGDGRRSWHADRAVRRGRGHRGRRTPPRCWPRQRIGHAHGELGDDPGERGCADDRAADHAERKPHGPGQ